MNSRTNKPLLKFIINPSFNIVLVLIIMSALSYEVNAIPPIACEFYGRVQYHNESAPVNTTIIARDINSVQCGIFRINTSGLFGLLSCTGDDPDTVADEGSNEGEETFFFINNTRACSSGDWNWTEAGYNQVLIWAPCFCGDNICYRTEDCDSCPTDCGICEGEQPPEGGGGEVETPPTEQQYKGTGAGGVSCKEEWVCTDWGECNPDEFQYRTCIDLKRCRTDKNKPAEKQSCTYIGTCFDTIKNCHDGYCEEDIDCGGPCEPCPNCNDGIKNCHNGACETDVDCGGPCGPCGNCTDNVQNCHDGLCETGIDCGGSCMACVQPIIERPLPALCGNGFCDEGEGCSCPSDCDRLLPWQILLIVTLFILVLITYTRYAIRRVRKSKRIKIMKRRKTILQKLRKRLQRIYKNGIALEFSTAIFVFYVWLFYLCPEQFYGFLLILAILTIIIFLVVHKVYNTMLYDEKRKIKRRKKFFENHLKQIQQFLRTENEIIADLEIKIARTIYRLYSTESQSQLMRSIPEIRSVYSNILKLSKQHVLQRNPYPEETQLCQDIFNVTHNKVIESITEGPIKRLNDDLIILYKRFENKQKLYNDIAETKKELRLLELGKPEDYQQKPEIKEHIDAQELKQETGLDTAKEAKPSEDGKTTTDENNPGREENEKSAEENTVQELKSKEKKGDA